MRYGLIGGAIVIASLWTVDYASRRNPPVEFLPGNGLTVPDAAVRPYRLVNGVITPVANEISWNPKQVRWRYTRFLGLPCKGFTNETFYGPAEASLPASDEHPIRVPTDAEMAQTKGVYDKPRTIVVPARIARYDPGAWSWGPESRLWCLPWQQVRWLNIVVAGPRLPFTVDASIP